MIKTIKESISLGLAYRFGGLVHCHRGRELGSTQAGGHGAGEIAESLQSYVQAVGVEDGERERTHK